ncbi:hypothetical protein [Streptomyces sp. AM 3-1-1]|uniref:hypothetical protein n=1 Tax=Streptomyces sp. AM 3-1-1 TaxID=3028711 RepID=UPI0023B96034|nr:hypothetical protein [Streptomyces sp. AM 3-1-1]WEH30225.1 hypothetical protein P0D76_24495 [Streptomyces sp. AM 3-1-1]
MFRVAAKKEGDKDGSTAHSTRWATTKSTGVSSAVPKARKQSMRARTAPPGTGTHHGRRARAPLSGRRTVTAKAVRPEKRASVGR